MRALFGGGLPAARAVLDALAALRRSALRARGERLHHLSRHLVGLFQGVPGARAWRRALSEHGNRPDAGWEVVEPRSRRWTRTRSGTPHEGRRRVSRCPRIRKAQLGRMRA